MRKEIEDKIKEVIQHNINHQLGLMGMRKTVDPINLVDAICELLIERLEKEKFFDNPYVQISNYARKSGQARNVMIDQLIRELKGIK